MIKIGIELPDQNILGLDLTKLKNGNPGVGGSEYLFALLGMYLKDTCSDMDCYIYHYNTNEIYNKDVIVHDEYDMLTKMQDDNIDIFIYQINKSSEWYEKLGKTNLKAIAWAHVYPGYREQRLLISNKNVKRVVFVGKEEYDAYVDSDLIKKSTYIYNMLNTKKMCTIRNIDEKSVTYVGALVPAKGFHVLARVWKKIVKEVPDAQLYIIGTGKVYDRNAVMGKWGIAQDNYEKKFMKYLTTSNDELLPSVHFMGLLGEEKEKIISKTMVGVVNPTGITETFCMSAVEMELEGIPVVSKKKWGLLDTVVDGQTGFLINSKSQLKRKVVFLLQNLEQNRKMGNSARDYVKKTFEAEDLILRWKEEITKVFYDEETEYFGIQKNYMNDNKWIKQGIRFIRFKIGISKFPDYETIKNVARKILK